MTTTEKKNKAMNEVEAIRQEIASVSRVGRVVADRIKPELVQFFDESVQLMTTECGEAVYEDSFLMSRFLWMISSVGDTFSNRLPMSDEDYELFQKYIADVAVIRKEVIGAYNTGEDYNRLIGSMEYTTKKVVTLWDIIKGVWGFSPEKMLFSDRALQYGALHRLVCEWDNHFAVGKKPELFLEKFYMFKHDHVRDYSEEQMFELFNDLWDSKKKFSEPIPVYVRVGTTYGVVSNEVRTEANYSVIRGQNGDSTVRIVGYAAF